MQVEYRDLVPGETIQRGDQFLSVGSWLVSFDIGRKVPDGRMVYRRPVTIPPPVITALRDMILLAQSEYPWTEWDERGINAAVLIYREASTHISIEPDPRVEVAP